MVGSALRDMHGPFPTKDDAQGTAQRQPRVDVEADEYLERAEPFVTRGGACHVHDVASFFG
eukprot:930596-Lingulodinium_polyedra.AAC.1